MGGNKRSVGACIAGKSWVAYDDGVNDDIPEWLRHRSVRFRIMSNMNQDPVLAFQIPGWSTWEALVRLESTHQGIELTVLEQKPIIEELGIFPGLAACPLVTASVSNGRRDEADSEAEDLDT
jgi:hypothetical protein